MEIVVKNDNNEIERYPFNTNSAYVPRIGDIIRYYKDMHDYNKSGSKIDFEVKSIQVNYVPQQDMSNGIVKIKLICNKVFLPQNNEYFPNI
jgi:hypothetical protein